MLRFAVGRANSQASVDGCTDALCRPYKEHSPGPDLRAFVECFWTQEVRRIPAGSPAASLRVLPDGCIDFIFHSNGARSAFGARIVGAITRPRLVDFRAPTYLVGVRFQPGGAFPFLGNLTAGELTDAQLSLTELWGTHEVERFGAGILDHGVGSLAEGAAGLERVLQARLGGELHSPAPWLGRAVAILRAQAGEVRIDSLCERLGLSRQHLARVFKAQVGLSPKQLARIFRLRRLLRQVRRERQVGREVNWSALAFDFGYCDQAHLSMDCRELTGLSPGRHLGLSGGGYEWLA